MKEPRLEQLHEEALLRDADQLAHLVRLALGQFLPVNPLRHEHLARGQVRVHTRHDHAFDVVLGEDVGHLLHVRRLVLEVELRVKAHLGRLRLRLRLRVGLG